MSDLTPKQQRFVDEYLKDLNATQAAIRAGYSADTAKSIGSENLTKPAIKQAVQKALEARSKRTKVSSDDLVTWLADIAQSANESTRDRISAIKLLGDHLNTWDGSGGKQSGGLASVLERIRAKRMGDAGGGH